MMHDTLLFHHLAYCLDCKGGKIKEYILHYEGTNAYVPALVSNCFVHIKGSSQFNPWDPDGCSLVHWKGSIALEVTWVDTTIQNNIVFASTLRIRSILMGVVLL